MRLKITKNTLSSLVREPGRKIIEVLDINHSINCFRQDSKIPNFESYINDLQTQIQNSTATRTSIASYTMQIQYIKAIDTIMDMICMHVGAHSFKRTLFSRSFSSNTIITSLANMFLVDNSIAVEDHEIDNFTEKKVNAIIKDINKIYYEFYEEDLRKLIFSDHDIFNKVKLYKLIDINNVITNNGMQFCEHQPFYAIEFLIKFNKTVSALTLKNTTITICFLPFIKKIAVILCKLNEMNHIAEDDIHIINVNVVNDDYYTAIMDIINNAIFNELYNDMFELLLNNSISLQGINNIYTGNTIHNLLVECHYKNNSKYVLLFDNFKNNFKEIKNVNDIEMIKFAAILNNNELVMDAMNIAQMKSKVSDIKKDINNTICDIGEKSITLKDIGLVFYPRITKIVNNINSLYDQHINSDRFAVAIKYTRNTVLLTILYELQEEWHIDLIELCIYSYPKKKDPYKIKNIYTSRNGCDYFSDIVNEIMSGSNKEKFTIETLEIFGMIVEEIMKITNEESLALNNICAHYFNNINNSSELLEYDIELKNLTKYINTFKTGEVYETYINNQSNNITINDTENIIDFLLEVDYYMSLNNRFFAAPIFKKGDE